MKVKFVRHSRKQRVVESSSSPWGVSLVYRMPVLEAVIFSSFWAFGLGQLKLEQPEISISRARDKSAHISCKLSTQGFIGKYIYWYRYKPDQGIEYLPYVFSTTPVHSHLGGKKNKLVASINSHTSTLKINFLEEKDEAVYYCACWTDTKDSGWIKIFAEGTKLIVTPPDKRLNSDISPKPTVFLPSVAEINLHSAGTYLCLLEKFFPDVIKVSWKEKNSDTILESRQGDTMKINDTYVKFSWLTVTAKSMNKEHKCIVKHENNKRGVDQEILFPSIMNKEHKYKAKHENNKIVGQEILSSSIKKEFAAVNNSKEACLKVESDMLQLQFTNTSAYYTYLLLLLKSMIYSAIFAFCLFRRTAAVCGNGKSL